MRSPLHPQASVRPTDRGKTKMGPRATFIIIHHRGARIQHVIILSFLKTQNGNGRKALWREG
jgi:hypothetical protein